MAGMRGGLNGDAGAFLKIDRIKEFRGRRMGCQCFAANLNYRDGAAKDDAMYIRSKYVAFFFKFSHKIRPIKPMSRCSNILAGSL